MMTVYEILFIKEVFLHTKMLSYLFFMYEKGYFADSSF